jgi:hypothetical protein
MKKVLYALTMLSVIALTGCFETTEEVTIKDDGSGTLVNTTDLSKVIGMAKQFAGDKMDQVKDAIKDTTISLASYADSVKTLSPSEKELIKDGTLALNVNMNDEKFIMKFNFPFKNASDIPQLRALSEKLLGDVMKKQMADNPMAGNSGMDMGAAAAPKSFDDFFDVSYGNGVITRKVNKEKYATVETDESMKSMKEMSDMGAPVTLNYVINLPRPAKKIEGKKVKLSEDKKKVSVSLTSEDFFDDPSKFEFTVEY